MKEIEALKGLKNLIQIFKLCSETNVELKDIHIMNPKSYKEAIETVIQALEQKDKEIQDTKNEYYSLINKIENKIDKFDYEFEKAKRKNDNDRANYYWDLIGNFKKLLEVVE